MKRAHYPPAEISSWLFEPQDYLSLRYAAATLYSSGERAHRPRCDWRDICAASTCCHRNQKYWALFGCLRVSNCRALRMEPQRLGRLLVLGGLGLFTFAGYQVMQCEWVNEASIRLVSKPSSSLATHGCRSRATEPDSTELSVSATSHLAGDKSGSNPVLVG